MRTQPKLQTALLLLLLGACSAPDSTRAGASAVVPAAGAPAGGPREARPVPAPVGGPKERSAHEASAPAEDPLLRARGREAQDWELWCKRVAADARHVAGKGDRERARALMVEVLETYIAGTQQYITENQVDVLGGFRLTASELGVKDLAALAWMRFRFNVAHPGEPYDHERALRMDEIDIEWRMQAPTTMPVPSHPAMTPSTALLDEPTPVEASAPHGEVGIQAASGEMLTGDAQEPHEASARAAQERGDEVEALRHYRALEAELLAARRAQADGLEALDRELARVRGIIAALESRRAARQGADPVAALGAAATSESAGDPEGARAGLEQALAQADEGGAEARERRRRLALRLGQLALALGDYAGASRAFQDARSGADGAGDGADADLGLGAASLASGDPDAAYRHYEEASKRMATGSDTHYKCIAAELGKARSKDARGDSEGARKALEDIVERMSSESVEGDDPQRFESTLLLMQLRELAGDLDGARELVPSLDQLAAFDPSDMRRTAVGLAKLSLDAAFAARRCDHQEALTLSQEHVARLRAGGHTRSRHLLHALRRMAALVRTHNSANDAAALEDEVADLLAARASDPAATRAEDDAAWRRVIRDLLPPYVTAEPPEALAGRAFALDVRAVDSFGIDQLRCIQDGREVPVDPSGELTEDEDGRGVTLRIELVVPDGQDASLVSFMARDSGGLWSDPVHVELVP
ncbi:MAG: hypothetical protein R3F49_16085 [Planctomycetota bacterium]